MNEIDIIYRNSLKFPPSNPRKKELLQQVQRGRNRHEEDKELAQVHTGYKPELRVHLKPKHRVFGLVFFFFSYTIFSKFKWKGPGSETVLHDIFLPWCQMSSTPRGEPEPEEEGKNEPEVLSAVLSGK